MELKSILTNEVKFEMGNTRRILERVPDDRMQWQPHAKSMTLSRLASHLTELPGRAVLMFRDVDFDIVPPGTTRPAPLLLTEHRAMLELFDTNVQALLALLESWSEADLAATWTFRRSGTVVLTSTRFEGLRRILLSHSIHHRGQCTVYLRENDVPLPPLYGPTADGSV